MEYGKVSDEVLASLREMVGEANVHTDEGSLEDYSHDETPLGLRAAPEVVVKPRSAEEVCKVLALADERRIPVTPRGRGTGLCNAAVPIYGGILLSLELMNRIIEVYEDDLMAVVEAGVSLSDLKAEAERRGLFYPGDPGEKKASIGGNVNTNAGGMNGVKYGVTRRYVLGLEVVLPSGMLLKLGGRTLKRSTGYELMQLLIGSEGTLGVVTKVIVRLVKLPEIFKTLYVPFDDLHDATKSVSDILRKKKTPTAIELVERPVVVEAESFLGKRMPHDGSEAYLIIRIEGDTEQDLSQEADGISRICRENNAVDVLTANTREEQESIWSIRSSFYEAFVKSRVAQIADAVIPPSKIPEYVHKVKGISKDYGVRIFSYGHAGDGNIHVHPMKDGLTDSEWAEKLPKVMDRLYREAVDLGGTVSGEHGIGLTKKRYLPISVDGEQLRLMREIKRLFDPNNILNPGKIFDES